MTETVRLLQRARSLAWGKLIPVFDWAIHEAREAEYYADVASNKVQVGIKPAYPPIVTLLAVAGGDGEPLCHHEAWESNGGSRFCTDCLEYLGTELSWF